MPVWLQGSQTNSTAYVSIATLGWECPQPLHMALESVGLGKPSSIANTSGHGSCSPFREKLLLLSAVSYTSAPLAELIRGLPCNASCS